MRLATLRTADGTRAVRLENGSYTDLGVPDVGALLNRPDWASYAANATGRAHDPAAADLAPPVPRPGKILCVGLNYRTHILEMGRELPAYPTLFAEVAGVDLFDPRRKQSPARRREAREDGGEVRFVLRSSVLRLEEEHDLRSFVWDAVRCVFDQLVIWETDRLVAPCDPLVPVVGLAEDIDAPDVRRAVEPPGLVDLLHQAGGRGRDRLGDASRDDVEVELAEGRGHLVEPVGRDRDLEILVLAPLAAEEEVDRPAGRHVPRRVHPAEPACGILRRPGLPLGVVRMHAADCTPGRAAATL